MRLAWRGCCQVCVDMASVTAKTMQPGDEACIRSTERSRFLDEMPGARTSQPEHALIYVHLVHIESLLQLNPFRQGPHVTALRMFSDKVAALRHLAKRDQRRQFS